MSAINIVQQDDRDLFRQRFVSGEPLRDWYSEQELAEALDWAIDWIDGVCATDSEGRAHD